MVVFCYLCFNDALVPNSAIDAFVKLILVITGSALIICFCHRLTNYKKARRYPKTSSGGHHHSAQLMTTATTGQYHPHEGSTTTTTTARCYGLPETSQLAVAAAYDPYNATSHRPPFSYCAGGGGNLLGTPGAFADPTGISYHPSPLDNSNQQYACYLRGPGSAAAAAAAALLAPGAMLPHLISNPVYSSQHQHHHHQQQQPSVGENNHHPLSEQDDVRAQQFDCLPDGVILDACPSYEEAIAASAAAANSIANNEEPTANGCDRSGGEQNNSHELASISSSSSPNRCGNNSATVSANQERENGHRESVGEQNVEVYCASNNNSDHDNGNGNGERGEEEGCR